MNPEDALDLRALADVEAPHVVQGALRRFRRKIFTTGALVLIAAASLVGGILWATVLSQTLPERIADGIGADVGAVYAADDVTVILQRVTALEEGLGLHFLIAAPEAPPGTTHFLRAPDIRTFDDRGGAKVQQVFLTIAAPDDGRISMRLLRDEGCHPPPGGGFCRSDPEPVSTFVVDLSDLNVPRGIWR